MSPSTSSPIKLIIAILSFVCTPTFAKQGLGAFVRANLPGASGLVPLNRRDFAGRAFAAAGAASASPNAVHEQAGWIVLFCSNVGENAPACEEARARVRQLRSLPWSDMASHNGGAKRELRFGQVDCGADEQLCLEQGLFDFNVPGAPRSRSVLAVYYNAQGLRLADWDAKQEVHSNDANADTDRLAAWVRSVFLPAVQASNRQGLASVAVGAIHSVLGPVFADTGTAVTGILLLIGQLVVVGWVIGTGFELWPEPGSTKALVAAAERAVAESPATRATAM